MNLLQLEAYLKESFESAAEGKLDKCRELEAAAKRLIITSLGLPKGEAINKTSLPPRVRRRLLTLEAIGHSP